MMKSVPNVLINAKNQQVLKHLSGLSCHSDIVLFFSEALKAHKQVKSFCPDPENFSYCLWYMGDEVFAFAASMQEIAIKLPPEAVDKAFKQLDSNELGPDWYLVSYSTKNWPEILQFLSNH